MTNLDQVCLFSNLITAPVQWCGFWVGVLSWEHLFYLQVSIAIYWLMIKISKGVAISKEGRIKYQGGGGVFFLLFYQSNLMSHFVPVYPISPDTTLRERWLG